MLVLDFEEIFESVSIYSNDFLLGHFVVDFVGFIVLLKFLEIFEIELEGLKESLERKLGILHQF